VLVPLVSVIQEQGQGMLGALEPEPVVVGRSLLVQCL